VPGRGPSGRTNQNLEPAQGQIPSKRTSIASQPNHSAREDQRARGDQVNQWWPLGQIETSNRKTVVGITATTKLWIQDMDYDQYRPQLVHHLQICWYWYSGFFSHFGLIPHQWQMMAYGINRNMKQKNSGGHCSNRQIVNSGHGLWSILTSYTI
jgi:hypothetical protein